jgi:hypothetical protein
MPLVPLLLSARGLTSEREPTRLKTGDLLLGNNLDFTVPGVVQKEPGSAKANTSALSGAPSILGGVEFWATESVQRRVIATADGKLYKDDLTGAFGTTLATGLNTARVTTFFAQGGLEATGNARKLFIMNGYDQVQVLAADGATTSKLATPPTDWNAAGKGPLFMFRMTTSAGELMVGGGTPTNPDYLYGALATNHETWAGGTHLGFNVYPGLGRRLVAGLQAFGRAFAWKYPRGIFWIDESAAAVTGWFAKVAHDQMGAAPTPWAVAQITDGPVAFINQSGHIILMEETSGTLSGVRFVDIIDRENLNLVDTINTSFNLGRLDRAHLHWDDQRKKLLAIFAAAGSSKEDRILAIDFNDRSRLRAEITTKDTVESLWFEQDSDGVLQPRFGDNAGFVWTGNQTARTVDGSAYSLVLQTAPTDFSDIKPEYAVKKAFYRLHLEYEPVGNFDVSGGVYIDGVLKGTVTFNMGTAGSVLPFTLPGTLGGSEVRRRYHDIGGDGYHFSLKLTESGANNPKLARAWVEFDPLSMVA